VLDLKADFNSANLLLLDMQAKKKTGAQASRAFTTKGLTCSSRRRGAGAGGGVKEPGVLPPRNGARVASRSQGSGRRGTKQEVISSPGVRTGGGDRRLLNEIGGRLLLRAVGTRRGQGQV
jgi:hypothetical protein